MYFIMSKTGNMLKLGFLDIFPAGEIVSFQNFLLVLSP